ncbi:MAG: ImpA family metalloprotease [Pseudomonadota bacterium]
MRKKLGWVPIAILAAACSGGDSAGSASSPATGSTPPSGITNAAPSIVTTDIRTEAGNEISMTLSATDRDGDEITFSKVSGPDWLSLAPDGTVSGSSSAEDFGTYELVIDASDGSETTRGTIHVTLFLDAIEQAFKTGDFTYITEHSDADIQTILRDEIAAIRARNTAAIRDIFELNPDGTAAEDSIVGITWRPSINFTSHFFPEFPYSFPLLTTNAGGPTRHYGILGEAERARFAAFGASPFPGNYDATNLRNRMLKNTIDWLVQTDDDGTLNIVLGHIKEENDEENARNWLSNAFGDSVSVTGTEACRGVEFATCVNADADLMIVFQDLANNGEREPVRTAIRDAMQNGVALIYVKKYNEDTGLGADIQAILRGARSEITYPRFTSLEAFSPTDSVYGWEPDLVGQIETLVTGIQNETHDYDLSVCVDAFTCEENVAFNTEIASGLERLREYVLDFDSENRDPFETYQENRFFAALMLTGDYYRSLTTFPMPKASTPASDIIRALFGELSVMTNRSTHPVMPDMGVFSRSDFETTALGDARVTLQGTPLRSTGLYALPGETFTITRNDSVQVDVMIQVNDLNTESGDPFRTIDGTEYRRPVFVNSTARTLRKTITVTGNNTTADLNDTVEITSIYGGPIFVHMDSPDEEIDLSFTNVAQHPVWRATSDNEAFVIDLAADEFDWAELITPQVALRSTRTELDDAFEIHRTPDALADAIVTYMHSWPFWLYGAHGEGILENPDLIAFMEAHGVNTTSAIESAQRWNAGNATCADGCGRNPFGLIGIPDPFSYASQLVRGKSLASELLTLSVGPEQAIADLYAIHGKYRRHQGTGETDSDCHPLPYEELYALVQAGFASGSPTETITDDDMRPADHQNAMYIQLMAALEAQGALDDGWTYLPRLNLITRIMNSSRSSVQGWNRVRRSVGFANWSHSTVNVFSTKRDRLFVTMSWAAQRNLAPYLEMWGYQFDNAERSHIERMGFETIEPVFYAIPETGHCTGLDYDELPVDGVSAWPQ